MNRETKKLVREVAQKHTRGMTLHKKLAYARAMDAVAAEVRRKIIAEVKRKGGRV